MDPLTIVATTVSTIKIVYQVSGVLYSFISDVSQIDTALQALADELESLKNAMVAIDKCLRSPSLLLEQTMEDENIPELFFSTNLALESCQRTLIQFEELLIKVRGNHPEPNAFRKSVIKAKMNFNRVDINNYRIRISTHSSALQMALQTLTLYSSMQNPDNVVNKLEPKLNVLFKLQEFLASFKLSDASENSTLGPPQADVVESQRNTLRLKTVAEKVVSRAATVVSGSTVYEQSVADPQDLRGYQQVRLSRWRNMGTGQNSDREDSGLGMMDISEDPDFDDEIELDVYTQLAGEGFRRIKEQNFAEAEKFCQEAQQAASRTRSTFHQNAASVQLALVYTKLGKFEDVRGVLVKVFSNPGSSLAWEHAAEGFHLLAQAHLELKQVKEAEASCDEAMRARRRFFGKSSPSFIESLNLRIAICEAKGDTILAIGYRNMLEAGKTPISDSCKVSTESTSLLSMPQTVASPSITKEDPERGDEGLSSGTTAVIEGSLPTQSYEPLQATEKLMNELELGANEIITRSLVRMRYRPYFINLRKFDPEASLLAAAEEGNIEVAWVLLTEFPRVRACHMQHMSEGFFPVAQTNASSTNAVHAIRARCHGDVLAKACMIEDSSKRKEMVNMLLESGIDSSVLTTKALRIKVTAPIVVACLRGHYDILADILRKGAQTSIIGNTGSHALEAILARGNHSQGGDEAASLLLSYSKDLKLPGTAPQSNGCTVSALGAALHLKWLKTTERLLKMGANVEDLNEDLNKQYFLPGWNFTPGVYELMGPTNFSEHFPYPKVTALCRAAGIGDQRSVALLLQYGANVDGDSSVLENSNSVVDSRRITTPLLLATACGNKPLVELLLGYGANVDLSGITRIGGPIKSPLLCAAGNGYSEILELLLEHGARIGSGLGISALQSAVDGGHQNTVSTLLDNGVEVKAHSPHVSTLLIRAAEKGYPAISKLLLERGARIGATEGAAALFIAIDSGRQDIVSALLGSGVDVNAKGPTGSALERATGLGHIEIVRILVQHGCEIQSLLIRWQREKRFGNSWEDVYAVAFREGSDASCFKPELAKEARLSNPSRLAVLLYNSMIVSAETALPSRGLWFTKEEVNNAFSIAVISHSWQNMKLLLDTGEVNPKGTHTNGMPWTFLTAGSKVFYGGHHLREAVEILIESGAEPDLFYGGHTLISYIILYHGLQPATFRFLLRKGACINGRKEVVPLCLAATAGQLEVVSCLLALGAEVNRLQDGHSARWYAQKTRLKKTKDNVKDPFAARQDHEEVDKLLKKKGGKVI